MQLHSKFRLKRFRSSAVGDSFEIVTDIETFKALQGDWDDLYKRSNQSRFSQSFAWCTTILEASGSSRKRRTWLHCVVARNAGRVVLIWPFNVYRKSYLSVAAPLGAGFGDYPDPLVEDGPDSDARVEAAWRTLRDTCGCDQIKLRLVQERSQLGGLMLAKVGNRVRVMSKEANLYVDWSDFENWDSYYHSLDRRDRRDTERRRRRLEECGKVIFEWFEGSQCEPLIDWALANKVLQFRDSGWLETKAYRNLLVWAALRGGPEGRVVVFALKLDDCVIATLLARVDRTRLEAVNFVYDEAYAKYAPGKVLLGACLSWAFERRLEFDMRGGDYPYKRRFANRECSALTYEVANSTSHALGFWLPIIAPLVRGYRMGKHKLGQRLGLKGRGRVAPI